MHVLPVAYPLLRASNNAQTTARATLSFGLMPLGDRCLSTRQK